MLNIGRLGVWYTPDYLSQREIVDLAIGIEKLNFDTFWYPEGLGYESFSFGSFILSQTSQLNVASGIANIYARDAVSAAAGHDSMNNLYGDRFILGLGVSHIPLVEDFRGHSYNSKPVTTMNKYLDKIEGVELSIPKVERNVILATLGPKMTALAGKRTKGAHPYLVTPEHTARTREIIGSNKWLCVEQKVCLTNDTTLAREAAAKMLSTYIQWPNYRNNWLSLGFNEEDLSGIGSNRFLDSMVAWGTKKHISDRINEHFSAGADHVCIQPIHPDGTSKVDWNALEAVVDS
ncbi:MAG: LLM class F420-dependent oxidoreductase [Rhodospirillaceae bacterium]|nr:LLM class F420-dependent oxidoreductase [Rhodospirillaceae bacterium]